MKRYRGFTNEVAPLGELGIRGRRGRRGRRGGLGGTRAFLRSGGIIAGRTYTPTLTAGSLVEGRDAEGLALPGWFETYCVPGSSVRKIVNGISTCPMYFRGVPSTETADRAMQELMEPVSPADQEIEKKQYAEGGDGPAELLETKAKIDEAIKRVTDGRVTTPTIPAPTEKAEMPAWLPLVIGGALIWIMK